MRLPKPYFGCYRSFKESLMESILAEVRLCLLTYMYMCIITSTINYLYSNFIQIENGVVILEPIEVKITGDGAPFSRTSSYILLSFSLPSLQKTLSSTGKFNQCKIIK